MRRRHTEGRRSLRNQAATAVWGVHTWTSTRKWGFHDSLRSRRVQDRQSGQARWGYGYWVTDFWYRWQA